MKYYFLFFFVLCSCVVNAQSYKKILAKYDIVSLLPEQSDGKAKSFWIHVIEENKSFTSSFEKIAKKGGSAREARDKISNAGVDSNRFLEDSCIYSASIDSLKYNILGNYYVTERCKIYLLREDDVNAFCTPSAQFPYFNICLFEGLIKALPEDATVGIPCLYYVLAHEFTHGLFEHGLFHEYKKRKKEKQNELLAGIAAGMATYNYSYSKARGVESKIHNLEKYNRDVYSWAIRNSQLYQYQYSREQEYQSDIVAFRLLDWLGIGGEAAITMLELIKTPYEYYDEKSDHPTIKDRIGLLKYMCTQKRIKP